MTEMSRPICAHCGALLPRGAGECQERPDLSIAHRVLVVWGEDGETLRASYPAQCLELVSGEDAVGEEESGRKDRAH